RGASRGGLVTIGRGYRLAAALLGVAVAASVSPAAAEIAAPRVITACALFRAADVRTVLGTPATLVRGARPSECALYGGQCLPVVVLANSSGLRGYRNLIRAAPVPVKPLRGIGP